MTSTYKFSREWIQVDFNTEFYEEVHSWCEQEFGMHPKNPDAWCRWWHKFEGSILFRDRKDANWFSLRWLS